MAHTGKIARLPKDIREIVNKRLDDGHTGADIANWLNEQPQVKAVMDSRFAGEPISSVNIYAWKGGGFLDWKRASGASLGRSGLAALLNRINEIKRMPTQDLGNDLALLLSVSLAMECDRLDAIDDGDERMKTLTAALDAFAQWRGAELDGGKVNLIRQKLEDLKQAAEKRLLDNAPKPKRTPAEQQARIRQILGTE